MYVDGTAVGSSDMIECDMYSMMSPPYYFGGTNPYYSPKVIESIVSISTDSNVTKIELLNVCT